MLIKLRASALIALTIIVVVLSSQEDSQRRKFIDNSADPEVPEGEEDFDWSFCNKKFRIVTYAKPPFIVIDQSKCEQDAVGSSAARKCPAEAFGDKSDAPLFGGGGGFTFDLLMNYVRPFLVLLLGFQQRTSAHVHSCSCFPQFSLMCRLLRRRNFVTKTIPSCQATKSRARLTRANRPVQNLTTHVRPTHRS